MASHFRVLDELTPEHLRQFDKLISSPKITVDAATKWLRDRGYNIHRSCVYGYMRAHGGWGKWPDETRPPAAKGLTPAELRAAHEYGEAHARLLKTLGRQR
jgi:hypothetical protein